MYKYIYVLFPFLLFSDNFFLKVSILIAVTKSSTAVDQTLANKDIIVASEIENISDNIKIMTDSRTPIPLGANNDRNPEIQANTYIKI